jgi:hypothetical protein
LCIIILIQFPFIYFCVYRLFAFILYTSFILAFQSVHDVHDYAFSTSVDTRTVHFKYHRRKRVKSERKWKIAHSKKHNYKSWNEIMAIEIETNLKRALENSVRNWGKNSFKSGLVSAVEHVSKTFIILKHFHRTFTKAEKLISWIFLWSIENIKCHCIVLSHVV